MEKYRREIKWNKEIEIERERNNAKMQEANSNRSKERHPSENRLNKREFPMIKIMFGVAFGTVLAGLATMAIKLIFIQAIIEPFLPNPQEKELKAYQAEVKLDHLKQDQQQVIQQRAIQAQRAENNIKHEQQKQSFKAQYKKPAECYNIQNHETRVNCANHYMRAKAAFDGN